MPTDFSLVGAFQVAGIIGGLFFTGYNIARDVKQKKIANYIEMTKGHRDIWKEVLKNDALSRITDDFPNIDVNPITKQEEIFVEMILLHANTAYMLIKSELSNDIDKFGKDLSEFIKLPIPKLVWKNSRNYQNRDFVKFVETGNVEKSWRDRLI